MCIESNHECYACKDGFYRDILGNPCRYNYCPICGRELPIAVPPHAEIVSRHEALRLINEERNRQDEKWGDQSGNHPFEWMSILGEEFGELCEAVNETCFKNGIHPERGGKERILKESIQVAAVALALAEAVLKEGYNVWGNE